MKNNTKQVDLLLLNLSNFEGNPVYPYAFVQVTSLARQASLNVKRFDFLQIPKNRREELVVQLIETHSPKMIGFHLRQTDSLYSPAYLGRGEYAPQEQNTSPYFPIVDTKEMIGFVQERFSIPIVVGGYGFTTHTKRLASYFGMSFGIQGEPNAFFENFEDVLAGKNLGSIPNLIYATPDGNYCVNERVFFGPLNIREYDEDLIDDMVKFYGAAKFYRKQSVSVAVEVMRGCNFECYFCTEPYVKGKKLQYRDIDVIMDEVKFLIKHYVSHLWFICSEINAGGIEFIMKLARRMLEFNQKRGGDKVTWASYNLPHFSRKELIFLVNAGYVPAWNEFLSFHDENLRKCKVPYRTKQALSYLDSCYALSESLGKFSEKKFDMFLGNAFINAKGISETLNLFDQRSMRNRYVDAWLTRATRVFELDEKLCCGSENTLVSISSKGVKEFDIIYPTFHYPIELMNRFKDGKAIEKFFRFMEVTFFSTFHYRNKDWVWFIGYNIPSATFKHLVQDMDFPDLKFELSEDDLPLKDKALLILSKIQEENVSNIVNRFYFPMKDEKQICNLAIKIILDNLFVKNTDKFLQILKFIGLHQDAYSLANLSEYRIMKILYQRFGSNDDLIKRVCDQFGLVDDSLDLIRLKYILYKNNVMIVSEYKELLFG